MVERAGTERRMVESKQITGSSNVPGTCGCYLSENGCNDGRSEILEFFSVRQF